MAEETMFDEAEEVEMDETEEVNTEEEDTPSEWKPQVAKESPKARQERLGVKEKRDGQILTIKEIFFTRPRTKKGDGTPIPPKKTIDEKYEYYSGKLGIRFIEDNLVEYYPNFHYFVNEDGKVSNFAKINREGENAVSQLFRLVVKKLDRPVEEVSDQDVYDYLAGKKVKVATKSGTYLGKAWFRNDITEIVE